VPRKQKRHRYYYKEKEEDIIECGRNGTAPVPTRGKEGKRGGKEWGKAADHVEVQKKETKAHPRARGNYTQGMGIFQGVDGRNSSAN